MSRYSLFAVLAIVGLSGCLETRHKTGFRRPDFSADAASVQTTSVAPVKTRTNCCGKLCDQTQPYKGEKQDLTTPPEPKKGEKKIGEFPEYQDEDDGNI